MLVTLVAGVAHTTLLPHRVQVFTEENKGQILDHPGRPVLSLDKS